MKKWMLVSIVIGFVLAVTACGSTQYSGASATATTALPLEGQLLVGTIKLESTTLAVSSDQAGQLLPLWETLQSLASSGTAATQEVDAVVSQIKSTMSSEQISDIAAMNLTQQDLATAVGNASTSSKTSSSSSTASASATQLQAGAPAAGDPGGGNPPVDMSSGMPASTGAQTGTAQATTLQSSGATNQVPAALITALVELLKKKIG